MVVMLVISMLKTGGFHDDSVFAFYENNFPTVRNYRFIAVAE